MPAWRHDYANQRVDEDDREASRNATPSEEIRTINRDGEPWFVGKDVAERLGYENQNRDIVRHVDEDDRFMVDGKTQYQNGIEIGQRGGWIINESGLYSLVLSSKLPTANTFGLFCPKGQTA